MKKIRIIIFGSTGSIGTQTLEIIREFPDQFEVKGLSCQKNIELLKKQCQEFSVKNICVQDEEKAEILNTGKSSPLVFQGDAGLVELLESVECDLLVMSVVGEIGTEATKKALQKKIPVALATKEVLVAHGEEVMQLAKENNTEIRMIDSEHSAIWQCLHGEQHSEIKKIWLTCSGGPFRNADKWPIEKLKEVTPQDALRHPNWEMGNKITIDSATLMNKALEFIEAVQIFELSVDQVEVVIHPESKLHSAVEFLDGSIKAQIGTADMRTAIAHAIFYPDRPSLPFPKYSFFDEIYHFEKVDTRRFPSLKLAKEAIQKKKCREFNIANEKAVKLFLQKKIGFLDIFEMVKEALR